jgi:hypothetical protein
MNMRRRIHAYEEDTSDVSRIPHELLTYLRMYCNTYPIVLCVKYFSTFNETLEHFKDV